MKNHAADTSRATIETEFCIIGAGPAGLAVAAELCRAGHNVVLLESGMACGNLSGVDEAAQELNDGLCVGAAYAGLRTTRHRGVGGTTLLWNTAVSGDSGAKYLPLEPWDFDGRWEEAPDGWPLSMVELLPWLRQAEVALGIASFADEDSLSALNPSQAARFSDGSVEPRVYQIGTRSTLIDPLRTRIEHASNAQLFTQATVVDFVEVVGGVNILVATDGQPPWTVRAKRVVLAAGAVENARLLLVSASRGGWPGDRSAWLGRGFMEHPRDRSLTLRPKSTAHYEALAFLDSHSVLFQNSSKTVLGRLGLTKSVALRENLLNASATLLPTVQPLRERVREVMERRFGLTGLQQFLPPGGHGWSRHPHPMRVFDGFTVLLNVEQPPRRENAITLSSKHDRFGVPLPELSWSWHTNDQTRLQRVRELFAAALRRADVGDIGVTPSDSPDPNAHHHAGTTRMHNDARHGVVNADGQVHGTRSVFVVGASTFPTAGFANPTLTIVAMALRLANYLQQTN